MKIYTIYRATNTVNNKCYIGYDSAWPRRKRSHLTAARSRKSTTYKQPFHHAIRKYGENAFTWEVLYQSKDQQHTLHEAETVFIEQNNSHITKNGYNLTMGGEGQKNRPMSQETRHKKSRALKGKPSNQSRAVYTPNGIFHSVVQACNSLNIHRNTLMHRIKSPLQPQYGYVGERQPTAIVQRDGRRHEVETPTGLFPSVKRAAEFYSVGYDTVVNRCNDLNNEGWKFTGKTF